MRAHDVLPREVTKMLPTLTTAEAVRRAHRAAIALPWPGLRWIEVRGEDRVRFLHGLLSNVVAGVPPGAGNESVLLTDKGRLVAVLQMLMGEDAVLLGGAIAPEALIAALDRYVIADDVELRTLDLEAVTVAGPDASRAVLALLGATPAGDQHAHRTRDLGGTQVLQTRLPGLVPPAFTLLVPGAARPAVLEAAAGAAGAAGTEEAAEVLRIEAGVPRFGVDMDADTLPMEVRLDHALHPTKGCYVGQETVVRVRARGHVNWLLSGVRVAGDALPAAGTAVRAAGREAGRLTSVARHPDAGTIALARLRREAAEPGTELTLEGGEAAVVAALPFATG